MCVVSAALDMSRGYWALMQSCRAMTRTCSDVNPVLLPLGTDDIIVSTKSST